MLTWISGDGIRRPEATSSRGRSLALADRLAVSLALVLFLIIDHGSAYQARRKGPSPLEPYAGELARAVLRGGELVGAIPSQ